MKRFMAMLFACALILSVGLAAKGGGGNKPQITFDPVAVQVGDTYTINGTGFIPGALVRVSGIYEGGSPGFDATVDEDGNWTDTLTAVNLGASTDGNKWFIGQGGPPHILAPGEVLHLVYQLEKKGKNKPFLWVERAEGFLTVTP